MRNYSVKETKVVNGKKTTVTINTEDAELVRSLLNAPGDFKKATSKNSNSKDNQEKLKLKNKRR